MKLKKFKAVLALSVFGMCAFAHADRRIVIQSIITPPMPNSFVSEGVYMTSFTCLNINTQGMGVQIATFPATLFALRITSAGINNASAQAFDSSITTSGVNLRPLTGVIDGRAVGNGGIYNVSASSGITISNFGIQNAPCVEVIYVER